MSTYELVVVGTSWGGLEAVSELLGGLPDDVEPALAVVQHRHPQSDPGFFRSLLQQRTSRAVVEVADKEPIRPRHVYVAPTDYHVLVEPGFFSLSTDERVMYARPSADVLFESAADAYGDRAIGIVLTGANADGAAGLAAIKRAGGVAVVQDPGTAEARAMPEAALGATAVDAVLPISAIGAFLQRLCSEPAEVSA